MVRLLHDAATSLNVSCPDDFVRWNEKNGHNKQHWDPAVYCTVVQVLHLTSHTLSVANILCTASVIGQLTSMAH